MIRVVDVMGNDLTVVNAARVSFSKQKDKFGEDDYRLLKYLLRHNRWAPFSHPQLTLHIKMPIFVARQWFKHMIGFSRNEVSRRYVDTPPEMYMPEILRERADNKKQGSKNTACAQSNQLLESVKSAYKTCIDCYNGLLISNVAPEQARMVLPQAMYTEFYETGSLAAYIRLIGLRCSSDAQKEIRDYADKVSDILSGAFHMTMAAHGEVYKEDSK